MDGTWAADRWEAVGWGPRQGQVCGLKEII